ncbi:MAG TPA: GNAT family N-acetyltransferase [Jiangellaceae bacterium]|nr:GNAT family N-acetyltransferase [Jiangellaceae bacterium]
MRLLPGLAARTWREQCVSAEEAVARVPAGAHVFVGGSGAGATPRTLLGALEAAALDHPGVELLHVLAHRGAGPDAPRSVFRNRVYSATPDQEQAIATARVDYVPLPLAELPRLMRRGRVRVDVALVQVTPPDTAGRCSLGVSVDATLEAVRQARLVVAEINPAMPWTGPHGTVPYERLDVTVEVDAAVPEYPLPPDTATAEQIARYAARLVDDGATLHSGRGEVPDRVLRYLGSRRDLGIHTDVITDAVLDLVATGVVTGRRKTMSRGRIVASTAVGSRRLYDLIDNNAQVVLRPIDEVADPDVVSAQRRMVSITEAASIDMTGQVCAEPGGPRPFGGVGAQVTFHHGAVRSRGGRAIVCLASTRDGESAVRAALGSGDPVTIPRWDIHWVVTEYGTANLHGASVRERAIALAEIAHPDHREDLLRAAADLGLLPHGQRLRSRRAYPVEEERVVTLPDGANVRVRPTRTSDAPLLQELFFRLRPRDVLTRFFRRLSSLTLEHAEHLSSVGYDEEMAFVAVVGSQEAERAVGTASYFVDQETGLADVAYMVDPEWQGRGLGTALHERTMDYARRHGVRGFTADVLIGNEAMMSIFRRSPGSLEVVEEGDRYEVVLLLAD